MTNAIPHILFLSNLLIEKGVFVLLDALRMLKEQDYSFICDFVGGETAEIDSKRLSEEVNQRGLNSLVVYHGKKYGAEKDAFFTQSDIFCFPTFYHNECFPIVLLEAMEHSLPCVSTDEGAISEMIEDGLTGFVVEKQNARQVAEKLAVLLSDKELRENMGQAARAKFEREFTLAMFENRLAQILNNCLAQ